MNGQPDILEYSKLTLDREKASKDHDKEVSKINLDKKKHEDSMKLELDKIKLEKEKLKQDKELQEKQMANDLTVARYRDKGTKNSPKKK